MKRKTTAPPPKGRKAIKKGPKTHGMPRTKKTGNGARNA